MTRDEAIVAMVDSNLHRERILPSEKAYAYKMKMEAKSFRGAPRQGATRGVFVRNGCHLRSWRSWIEYRHSPRPAGIGKLILCDFDRVDITNLHRQQYKASQIGMLLEQRER